jgi:hypothetical protein
LPQAHEEKYPKNRMESPFMALWCFFFNKEKRKKHTTLGVLSSFSSLDRFLKKRPQGHKMRFFRTSRIRYHFFLALNTALEALYLDPKDCRMIAR